MWTIPPLFLSGALLVARASAFVPAPTRRFLHAAPRLARHKPQHPRKEAMNIASLVDQAAVAAVEEEEEPDLTNGLNKDLLDEEENEEEEADVDEANAELPESLLTDEEDEEEVRFDQEQMRKAIELAESTGGERGATSPYPKPIAGAVIVTPDGRVLGRGYSDYKQDCVLAAIKDAGLTATPLREWCVTWPHDRQLREDLASATLYVTMEPTSQRQGEAVPPMTQLIQYSGIRKVVIGCPDVVTDKATEGASSLYAAGIQVSIGVLQEECEGLVSQYAELANSKLQVMARKHSERYGKPLGFLHCSVIDSDSVEAFARQGNAFGKSSGGKTLSFRDFGSYEMAPPPESVWADDMDDDDDDFNSLLEMDFSEEEAEATLGKSPMMPWYEQVDAVIATFPRADTGPANDTPRINGLKWMATIGQELPANVERILVLDATDLKDLPLTNDHPTVPPGVDVEAFWRGDDRKPTRVLLRKGENVQAQAAAAAAAVAAQAAADAAKAALEAVESGEADIAAEAAFESQEAAAAATKVIQRELQAAQELKSKLTDVGVVVETINGQEVIDVMKHLGKRNGYSSVVWRAGCWGNRGPMAIMDGAFQWVSAHLAVDAVGGKFWQLMLAERAVQAACGAERKVKIFADQEDISLEYCDEVDADEDCVLSVDGRPIRHIRLDARVGLVDDSRPRSFVPLKTKKLSRTQLEEQAPWFL